MDLAEETLKVQEKLENKARSISRGKLGRILKMARKPDTEEFKRTCLITFAGMALIGGIGFLIYLCWTYIPPAVQDWLNLMV
jgi:protein transport protein SEC61 subunit gamma-like protein